MINTESVLKQNRHSSAEPYEWFGPDPEPNPPGIWCVCIGCQTSVYYGRWEDPCEKSGKS